MNYRLLGSFPGVGKLITVTLRTDWHRYYPSWLLSVCVCVCVCLCVLVSVFAHICTSLISLGKCSLAQAGSSLADAFAWWDCGDVCVCVEGVGCNCGNCKQSLVLSSSFFPLSQSISRICCVPVHVCVYVCHHQWVMSRSLPTNNIACAGAPVTWDVTVTVRLYPFGSHLGEGQLKRPSVSKLYTKLKPTYNKLSNNLSDSVKSCLRNSHKHSRGGVKQKWSNIWSQSVRGDRYWVCKKKKKNHAMTSQNKENGWGEISFKKI